MRFPFLKSSPKVAVLRLSGVIASGARGRLSDQALAPLIERAFRRGRPAAVALILNSPGGSPAQSSLIAARIRRLADERNVPVHAFVEDVAASGGYWLATAADHIWLDASSIVGSIGVISASFGLQEAIGRLGIERRVHTAGQSKSWLDPFQPEKPEDIERLRQLQDQIHALFIAQVKARRPGLAQDDRLFTGEVWVGEAAVKVGLADGIGHLVPVMQARFGPKTRFLTYGPRRGLLSRFGLAATSALGELIDERAAFARFGL